MTTYIRATISLKKSEDFFAGENLKVLQSGYYKNNYKIDMTKLFNTNHVLEFSFIGDNAEDIGYPLISKIMVSFYTKLLMDFFIREIHS